MRYCIGRGVIGPPSIYRHFGRRIQSLKGAKRNIFVLLGVEEKFGMIADNYLEYENDLLKLALDHMAWHSIDWPTMHDATFLLNRRLANLLTISRLYTDQVKHDLSQTYGEGHEVPTRVRKEFSTQYDRLLGYRVMEGLRNFVQHRSLLIAHLEYPAGWEDRKEGQLLHHRACAHMSIPALREGDALKPTVLRELEQKGRRHTISLHLFESTSTDWPRCIESCERSPKKTAKSGR
jgi:hypothetical protein